MNTNTMKYTRIHDQGAGGNGNVLKELVEPEGGVVFTKEFQLGDPTLTTLELWGAEYQENDALLCSKENRTVIEEICKRERCPVSFVGEVTGDGYMSLIEDSYKDEYIERANRLKPEVKSKLPYELHLEAVLGIMAKAALILLTILATLYICNGYKILVIFPLPGKSHNILGEGVVSHLLDAGHEVTYVTPFPKNGTNSKLKYVDLSTNMNIIPKDLLNLQSVLDKKVSESWMKNFVIFFGNVIATSSIEHANFQKVLADPNEHFDLVIGEWFFNELYSSIGAVYNVPYVWLSTIDPHWMILSLIDETLNPSYNGYTVTESPPFTFWQRVEELWFTVKLTILRGTIGHYLQYREYSRLVAPHIEKRGRIPPAFEDLMYNSSLVLGNSHVSMGAATRLPQNYKPIGGYHIKDNSEPLPENLKTIIEGAKHGVIYFSMGSNLKSKDLPDIIKTGLLKTFASLKQTVLWKFEEVLPNLPNNVHIIAWAPQLSILAHPNVRLFITHGGLLSTTETISAGKPIIGIPVFADQFINVVTAVNRGFAKKFDLSYTMAEELKTAIEEIIDDPKYAAKAKELQFIHHDRPVKPGQELVHWVEHVIKTKGAPHLRSPALLVPWYQKIYLDFFLLIFIIFKVLKYFYCRVKSMIFSKKSNIKKKNS